MRLIVRVESDDVDAGYRLLAESRRAAGNAVQVHLAGDHVVVELGDASALRVVAEWLMWFVDQVDASAVVIVTAENGRSVRLRRGQVSSPGELLQTLGTRPCDGEGNVADGGPPNGPDFPTDR